MPHIPLIFIIAGEASGDLLGADLMASLKEIQDVRFAGVGGPAMTAQGLTSLFPMEELSIMGVWGILRNLPHLLGRLRQTVETIHQMKPDVVVTIDAPEFSFRVLKRLHKLRTSQNLSERCHPEFISGSNFCSPNKMQKQSPPSRGQGSAYDKRALSPRLVHYVAPTVWAWRPGRAQKISRFVDCLLCLYPFEPPYFEKYGLKAIFVGHPVAKEIFHPSPAHSLREFTTSPTRGEVKVFSLSPCGRGWPEGPGEGSSPLLCVLPGSRRSEIDTLMPIFEQTVFLMQKEIPDLRIVLPTLPGVKSLVERHVQGWPVDVQIVVGEEARNDAFHQASVALAASGTVALQLAAAGLPFVIAYKLNKFNELIARLLLKTPWACMVNILLAFHAFAPDFVLNQKAKKKIKVPWIPEFLQQDCTPKNLATALIKLFNDPQARETQKKAMTQAIALLKAPSHRAAEAVMGAAS